MGRKGVKLVEIYVKETLSRSDPAHNYDHVDRVRKWAVKIAKSVKYKDLLVVETSTLLHDVGLSKTKDWSKHAEVGAKMAERFLTKSKIMCSEDVKLVVATIKDHSNPQKTDNKLLKILRDADMLDMLGAIGIARTFTSQSGRKMYNPKMVKGSLWKSEYRAAYKKYSFTNGAGETIVDQINFQTHCLEEMNSQYAKKAAKKLIAVMTSFIKQLDSEVKQSIV